MDAVIKVINDINSKFNNIIQVPFNSDNKKLNYSLNEGYKLLIKEHFNKFIEFLKEYEFPEDFPKQFSFCLCQYFDKNYTPSGITVYNKELHKLWETNIYVGGTIKDIEILHSILHNSPDTFLKIANKGLAKEVLTFYGYQTYNMLYPKNKKATEIFVNNFLWPSIKILFFIKHDNLSNIISLFTKFTMEIPQNEIYKKIYFKFKKAIESYYKKIKSGFWEILLYSIELIIKFPDFLVTLCKIFDHNCIKKEVKEYILSQRGTEIAEIFSQLPAEILLDENIPNQLLTFAIGNKNLLKANPKKFRKIFVSNMDYLNEKPELIPDFIHIPQDIISTMTQKQFSKLDKTIINYYGIKIIFPFKFIPIEKRKDVKSNFIVKKLIEKLLKKYVPANQVINDHIKAKIITSVIEKAKLKGLKNNEIDILIRIILKFTNQCNLYMNIQNLKNSQLPLPLYKRYIKPLKKFLYSSEIKIKKLQVVAA